MNKLGTESDSMAMVRLHEVDWEVVPRDAAIFLCLTSAGFPSPAQDDMEEPIDLGAWLINTESCSPRRIHGKGGS